MRLLGSLGLWAALAACERAKPIPTSHDRPEDLVAVVARRSSIDLVPLRVWAKHAGSIGATQARALDDRMLLAMAADETGADLAVIKALDDQAALYVLVEDGEQHHGVALLAHTTDRKAALAAGGKAKVVTHDDWALVGPAAVVDDCAGYAFGTLATTVAGGAPSVTIYVPRLYARERPALDAWIATFDPHSGAGRFARGGLEAVGALASELDRATATLSVSGETLALELSLVPRAGSRAAAFAAAQGPSDFALRDRLDANARAVAAGSLALGAYGPAVAQWASGVLGFAPAGLDALLAGSTGAFAIGLYGEPPFALAADAVLANGATDAALVAVDHAAQTGAFPIKPAAAPVPGVHAYELTGAAGEPQQHVELAATGKALAIETSSRAAHPLAGTLAALTAAQPPPLASALAASFAATGKRSAVLAIDLARPPAPSAIASITLGFEPAAIDLRIELPAAAAAAFIP